MATFLKMMQEILLRNDESFRPFFLLLLFEDVPEMASLKCRNNMPPD